MSRAVPDTEHKSHCSVLRSTRYWTAGPLQCLAQYQILKAKCWIRIGGKRKCEWQLTSPQNGWSNARNQKASEQKSSSMYSGWNYQSAGFSDGSERRRQPQYFFFLLSSEAFVLQEISNAEEELDVVLQLYVETLKLFPCRLFFVFCAPLSSSSISLHTVMLQTLSADVRLSRIADGHDV